jgi:hypothetical protein
VPVQGEVEILEALETYDEVNGKYQFTGTAVVYRSQGSLFHIFLTNFRKPSAKLHQLTSFFLSEQGTLIPINAYAPKFRSDKSLSRAPSPLPADTYIKRPSLTSFNRFEQLGMSTAIDDDVLREANVCEILLRSPYPVLANIMGARSLRKAMSLASASRNIRRR